MCGQESRGERSILMRDWGFVGGSYRGYSPQSCPARSINLFVQTVAVEGARSRRRLVNVPGKLAFATLTAQPVRGLFFQDGRLYAVGGDEYFEVFANGSIDGKGSVQPSGDPVVMASNGARGNQVAFASGGRGYIFNTSTNTLTPITDAQLPASILTIGYGGGYFLAVTPDRFGLSASLDGTAWAGDEGQRLEATEAIRGAIVDHELLWLFGHLRTEIWHNSGAAAFPWEPLAGVFLESGVGARHAICRLGDSICWLLEDERGGRQVVRNQGYNAVTISHAGINAALSALDSVVDARMFSYQIHGHLWAVLTIPSQRVTFVYDATEQEWFELASWNTDTGQYEADRASCHAYAFGKHLVGDRETGTIWELSMDVHADGDDPIRWLRIGPTLSDENRTLFFHRAELDGAVGVGDVDVQLRVSDDAGKTWSTEQTASLGAVGDYATRPQWHMLGSSRNRAFELSGVGAVETVINDLLLDVTRGTH